MSDAFTAAALIRLADCVRLDVEFNDSADDEPLTLRGESAERSSLTAWDINLSRVDDDGEEEEYKRRIGFLGLVELAAASRYINLAAWDGAALLAKAVGSLGESVGATALDEPRLICVKRLMSRLNRPSVSVVPREPVAFNAFESYLSLTRSVFADQALIDALVFAHESWVPGSDRVALLTPRHLADALATGYVGAVKVPGIAGLPRYLEAFEWLVSIIARVQDNQELHDGMLVNALWSHAAWVPRWRADEWAVAMSEWSPRRDLEGELRWTEFRTRVFVRLEEAQQKLGLDGTWNIKEDLGSAKVFGPPDFAWSKEVPTHEVDARVTELLSEGRDEAARRTLHGALGLLSRCNLADVGIAELLVRFARRLADLGDLDSAAAFVAPHLALLKVGRGHEVTDQALELVARATRPALEETPSAEPNTEIHRRPEASAAERLKSASRGETA